MPAVVRISVAELKPDDVLVFECDEHVSSEAAERIKATAAQVFPGRKVMVLDKALKLKVLNAGEKAV